MDTSRIVQARESVTVPDVETAVENPWQNLVAALGCVVGVWWLLATSRPAGSALMVVAVMAVVPLGLRLADNPNNGPVTPALQWLRLASYPVGLLAFLALALDTGPLALLLALPWLVLCTSAAIVGFLRLLSRRQWRRAALGTDLALLVLAPAGLFFVLARLGVGGSRFAMSVGTLTTLAFGLPLIAGVVGRWNRKGLRVPAAALAGGSAIALLGIQGRAGLAGAVLLAISAVSIGTALGELLENRSGRSPLELVIGRGALAIGALLKAVTLLIVQANLPSRLPQFFSETSGEGLRVGIFELAEPKTTVAVATLETITEVGFVGLLGGAVIALLAGLNRLEDPVAVGAHATTVHVAPRTRSEMDELLHFALTQKAPALDPANLADGFRISDSAVPADDFDNSCDALLAWAGHEAAGITLRPSPPPIAIGETFAMQIAAGPLFLTAACRITDIINEPDRYGFTYCTLDHHSWEGTESIVVTRQAQTATGAESDTIAPLMEAEMANSAASIDPETTIEQPIQSSGSGSRVEVQARMIWRPKAVAAMTFPRGTEELIEARMTACLEGIAKAENVLVGEYMNSVVSGFSSDSTKMTRESLRRVRTDPVGLGRIGRPIAVEEPDPAPSDMLSFDAVFNQPFDSDDFEPEQLPAD